MTEDDVDAPAGGPPPVAAGLPEHPVRRALLELFAETGTLTATQAAARLGYSSGLCSFHLRQLARYGLTEEAPHIGGRARPWRLRRTAAGEAGAPGVTGFGELARGLEDESYRGWLARRDQAPAAWRQDEAFSAVVYLTPGELRALAETVRRALVPYQERERRAEARPADALPVALVTRLFPLLPGLDGPVDGAASTDGTADPDGAG